MPQRFNWTASIGCEGGPLLLANVRDFSRWPGALATLRPKTTLQLECDPKLLPKSVRPPKGQQDITYPTPEAALAARNAIRDAVREAHPKTKVTEDETTLHLLLPNDATIEAQLGPLSEYDASWRAHPEDETWLHTWGKDERWCGFFWQLEGGCVVDVGATANRDELIMVQSFLDAKAHRKAVQARVEKAGDETEGAKLTVTSGHVVAIWSPTAVIELEGLDDEDVTPEQCETVLCDRASGAKPAMLSSETIEDLGTALMLAPGAYTSSTGEAEGDGWSARWCRLKRT